MKIVMALAMLLLVGCNNLSVNGNRVSYCGFDTTYKGDSSKIASAITVLKALDYCSDDVTKLRELLKEVR
jgi:uncharacterized lipoprotein NlpE involved in copper resistance